MLVQEAPEPVVLPGIAASFGPKVFPLSAMSEAGLHDLAGTVADWLADHPNAGLADLGHTLSMRRSPLAWRAGVVAASADELVTGLRAVAAGAPGTSVGRMPTGHTGEVVWVFSGHGAQWPDMCRELLREEPVFAAVLDRLAPVFRDELGWTPREIIIDGGPRSVGEIQAMTFATQVGLAALWRRYGVEPGAVIGHSVGEIAAAVVAGALDLTDAARFACRRSAALQRLAGLGRMALVQLGFGEAERRLADRCDVVAAIAASPGSTVISGDRNAVERVMADWTADGIGSRWVDSDVAFHSPGVDPVVAEVAAAAGELHAGPPRIPLYTTALADPRSTAPRGGDYWVANLRQPVRFANAVAAALHDGHRIFLEVSTHPVVAHSIRETCADFDADDAVVTSTLRRDNPEQATVLRNLADLVAHGATVDWSRQFADGALLDLPVMTWQRRPYWIFHESTVDSGRGGGGHDPARHTLLGGRSTVGGVPVTQVWQTYLDMSCRPYAQDHKVAGVETVPASVVINSFVSAAARDDEALPGLTDLVLRTPIAATPPRIVQVVLDQNTVLLTSRIAEGGDDPDSDADAWITHCTATVDPHPTVAQRHMTDIDALRARCPEEWSWTRADTMFRNMGVEGYTFPWVVEELRRNDVEQLAVLTVEPPPATRASTWTAVIDGALTVSGVLVTDENARQLRTSSRIDAIAFRGEPPARVAVHTVRSADSPQNTIDVLVSDLDGQVVCEVSGLRFTPVQDLPGAVAPPRELVHEIVWHPLPAPDGLRATVVPPSATLVGDDTVIGPLAKLLTEFGVDCGKWSSPEEVPAWHLTQPGVLIVAPEPTRPGESAEQAAERCAWTLIRATQRMAEQPFSTAKLWCLTRGVRQASSLAHAPLWGVSRIIAGERPDLWGGVVDLAADDGGIQVTLDGEAGERLLSLMSAPVAEEDVISLTPDDTTVARLARIDRPAEESAALRCDARGTYLITGGLGAIGLEVARWLVDRGARRLVLAGRRGLPPRSTWATVSAPEVRRQIDAVLAIEALGVTVRVLALDIADAEQVAAALDPSALELPPIRGVVHAAGVVADSLVGNVELDELRTVLAPKANGAMVLHRLYPPGTLDFFVLFSSCGQLVRLTGQAGYAAANSFLDGLAAYRCRTGHRETTSLAWTSWRGIGMAETTSSTVTLEANLRGMDGISATEAFRAWTFAERFPTPYRAILRVLPPEPHTQRLALLSELATGVTAIGSGTTIVDELADLPVEELLERVTTDVAEQVAAELNLPVSAIELKRPLIELGVDSLLTVGLRVRLQRRYGVDLPPTILWGHPTVATLTAHLVETLQVRQSTAEPAQVAS
jgi:6-methylsalicylic acid synthase